MAKIIYANHRDNTVMRVVVVEPPKKGYRLEFFDPDGSYAYELPGKVIREIAAAVEKFRAAAAAAQQQTEQQPAGDEGEAQE